VIEQHYKTEEVAARVAVNPETVRRAAARGELKSLRIGRDFRFPESAVLAWLASRVDRRGKA
jgi:excisionase family DNA binding protein